ncbi:hypothetical protein CEXT_785021 [Caerostris extrusa]|uniref:Uncharacterized protein n=1 Tax=Caerostris extrusa TaxID=172846 RepID=A0AAV4PCN3_CAEEX|nr:hypothetical protein CEXT_268921 [Caerostris extrusa]GIY32486.1 hypothetical protein CEXT_785021 [Caerostris extrusa]
MPPIMVKYSDSLKGLIAEISKKFHDETEYYVITPKNLRPLKAVLKGLPVSYNVNEISTGLAELGLQIDEVRQLTNLKTRALIPVWQLVYKNPK